MWNFRELTLAGKIQIFKSLALSKAVYIGTMTSPSRQFLDQLNLLKRDFIWDGKSAKIKHSTLIGCYAEGGYKDVVIESKFKSLKIIWIKGCWMTIFIHGRLFQINCSPLQACFQCFVKLSNPLDTALNGFLVFRNFIRN